MRDSTSWFSDIDSPIYICGVGARTPLGFNAPASAAAVRGGISAVEAQGSLADKEGAAINLARDGELELAVPIAVRMEQMVLSAVQEAIEGCVAPQLLTHVRCCIGLPEARPGIPDLLGDSVARAASVAGGFSPSAVRLVPSGHASGLMAMQFAARAIAAREADLYVVAGVDSYCDRLTLEWLDQTGSLLSATNRNGFPPGEAAGACVLASSRAVRQYQLPVLAQVAAAATCVEPKTLRSAAVCVGEGLTTALKTACSVLDRPAEVITATYCDLNGERYRNEEFVYTLLRVQDAFLDAHDYTCPADCWGDVGAASGPLFAALAVAAVDRGYAKGILPLLWTGSISGYRSAVVLRVQESSSTEEQQ